MFHRTARVLEHVRLADRTYRVRLDCPDIAAAVRPGQFVMLRLPDTADPLLGRPFALYDTVLDAAGSPVGLDVVYLVVGKMTGRLAEVNAGESLQAWGPLGKPFLDVGEPERVDGRGDSGAARANPGRARRAAAAAASGTHDRPREAGSSGRVRA